MVICLQRGANDLHYSPADATATHHLLLQWNPELFYLSGAGLKPNSITLSGSKLVADRFEAGRRPASNQL